MGVFRGESRSMLRHLKRAVEISGRAAEEGSVGGRSKSLGKCHAADSKNIHLYEKEIVMKNTVKKILALVFAVVMVCSLAVPALAADEAINVYVTVVGKDGVLLEKTAITLSAKKQNLEQALKDDKVDDYVTVNSTSGKVTALNGVKVTAEEILGEFGTGSVVVALNGKAVSEDLGTVAVEKGDEIVVYWADSKLGTKLVLVDDSRLAEGIVSLYYYNAAGERKALSGAKFALSGATEALTGEAYFTTDEKGQIWLAPEYLDAEATYTIGYAGIDGYTTTIVKAMSDLKKDDGYTQDEIDYAKKYNTKNAIDIAVIGYEVAVEADMYTTADATGDMTMVYVLVAAAAVVTLAAVVVMKKKAVKAN